MDEITRALWEEALDVRARAHEHIEYSMALRRRSEEIRRQSSRLTQKARDCRLPQATDATIPSQASR
jgi:hypothetical protein